MIDDLAREIMTRPVGEQQKPFAVDAKTWHRVNVELHRKFDIVLAAPEPVPNFLLCGVPVVIGVK